MDDLGAIRFDFAFVDRVEANGRIVLNYPIKVGSLEAEKIDVQRSKFDELLSDSGFDSFQMKPYEIELLLAVALAEALSFEEMKTGNYKGVVVRSFLNRSAHPLLPKTLARIQRKDLRIKASNGWAFYISPEEKIHIIERGHFKGPELNQGLSHLILALSKFVRKRTHGKMLFRRPEAITLDRKELHEATCAECGKEIGVPFKPDTTKQVFCRECWSKKRPSREPPHLANEMRMIKKISKPEKKRGKRPLLKKAKVKGLAIPRYIQGRVLRIVSDSELIEVKRAFWVNSHYLLEVRIGPIDSGWLSPHKEAVFPDEKLTWEQDKADLQVIFNEPNHSPEPQMENITLPKYGSSSSCQFHFGIKNTSNTFLGRIIVLHRNRVIQTALLKGEVVTGPNQPSSFPIKLSIESLIRKDLSDLSSRQEYDVALIANHTEDGEPTLTGVAGERAMFRSLKNVETVINKINEELEKIVVDPNIYPVDIFSKKITSWIRQISFFGRALYEGIIVDMHLEEKLQRAKCIQLLSKRFDYLPLEFLYDASPPDMNAPLCPETKEALKRGSCTGCRMKDDTPTKYICPLGFWFLKMIIERHLILDPDFETKESEFGMDFEPINNRNKLQVLKSALFAASSKVDEITSDNSMKILSLLKQATNGHANLVKTWSEWENAIKTNNPSLLVLIAHTSKGGPYNLDQIEIGENSTLFRAYITKHHHVRGSEDSRPVLLLLGCDTGVAYQALNADGETQVDVPFQTFAAKFIREGAVIVVSTLTKILARHAVPVAETLIKELTQSAEEGKSLGDTLLQTRKRYFIEGIPMALTLIANGDADWRFALS